MSAAELLLDDEDEDVRAWAEAALNRLRGPVASVPAPAKARPAMLQAPQPAQHAAAAPLSPADSAASARDLLQDDDDDVRAWAELALRQGRGESAARGRGSPAPSPKPSTPLGRTQRSRGEQRNGLYRSTAAAGAFGPEASGQGGEDRQLRTAGSLSFSVPALTDSVDETQSDVISVCVRSRGLNAAERPGGSAWKMDGTLIWEAEAEVRFLAPFLGD